MKDYCFDGFLFVGTGKIKSLSDWTGNRGSDLLTSCPKDFAYIRFFPQSCVAKGLFKIFVDNCRSLPDSLSSLKSLLVEYGLDFYICPKYSCISPGSAILTNSIRRFRPDFDFESV